MITFLQMQHNKYTRINTQKCQKQTNEITCFLPLLLPGDLARKLPLSVDAMESSILFLLLDNAVVETERREEAAKRLLFDRGGGVPSGLVPTLDMPSK